MAKSLMRFMAVGFLLFLLLTRCESISYQNHALLRAVPYDETELKFYRRLRNVYNVTWWKAPTLVNNKVEFSISPRNLARLYRDTEKMTVRFAIVIRNIQSAFDKQKASIYLRQNIYSYNWNNFYRLDDIYAWLKDLSIAHPEEVQLRKVGSSHENRTILSVRLTLKGSRNRSKVIVEGGCHGREWMSPAFVTYMLFTLLNAKKYKDSELERVAYLYTWIFIPVMNPDGYDYSHTKDRLWRKNRAREGGVDLNRNYGIDFGNHGSGKSPTSSTYCGRAPFSEPESYAMANLAREHRHSLEYYISFHSYGQYMIIPYTFTSQYMENFSKVKAMADKAAARIKKNHGMSYKTGTSLETTVYLASGVSSDWVKSALQVPYVLTIELPDKGTHGYALPPGQILPACQATMDGLLEFLAPQSDKFLRMHETVSATRKNQECFEVIFLCNVLMYLMTREVKYLE